MSADRNLLVGMLALHNGFVSREQLLDALNAWMLRKETPLGDLFRERGLMAEDDLRLLDGLVDRQIQRHGGARKSLASLRVDPEARRDLARLADDDVQASVAALHEAATPAPDMTPPPPRSESPESNGSLPAKALRYQRMHAHANGGLGEVFVALDEELNRRVALKQIQEPYAEDADSRRRFVREAKITGNLEHPGVVPVYGLLTDGDGRPVYAMRFIKGESLHDAIARFHAAEKPGRDPGERSLSLRDLLTRFVAVCNAVGYAHSRGILHRDLKPANVMLGEYGETLVVDWGLARVLVQSDPEQTAPYSLVRLNDAETETRLGKALGTPAYMPPEQARGEHDRVGMHSDVWALGATLYALLTGRAPYRGPDVMLSATMCEFPPPRQVNPRAPRALEAVCLKAMASKPEDRYATARVLAAEVEHWLADEPVTAYREPLVDRARRWGRRNRPLVASGVVLLATGVVGLSVGLWAVGKEQTRAAQALERALLAEKEANGNFEQARKAVDDCFGLAKDDPLLQAEHLRKVRLLLLKKTLPFYEVFAAKTPDDEALLARQADYLFRVASITEEINRKSDALLNYERARDILLQFSETRPEVSEHQANLARTLYHLGWLQSETGKPQGALESYLHARDILLRLGRAYPGVAEHQAELAKIWNGLGSLQSETGKPQEAIKSYLLARDIRLRLSNAHPELPEHQEALATTWHNLGNLQSRTGEPQEALESYLRARDIRLSLIKAHPEVTQYQARLAKTWIELGLHQDETGKPQEALPSYEQAREILLRLSQAHPEVTLYQARLAKTWNNLGILQGRTGKPQEAVRSYERARDIYLQLIKSHPEAPDYHVDLAGTHVNLANLQRDTGNASEGLKSVNQAIPLLLSARQYEPRNPTYRLYLRNAHWSRAVTLAQLGRHRDAAADWGEVLRLNAVPADSAGIRLKRLGALMRAGDHYDARAQVEDLAGDPALADNSVYNLSCAAALSAAAVARDASRPLPERDKQAEAWSRRAVELLRRAATAGFFRVPANRAHLAKDADLAFLRDRADFRAFLQTLPPVPPAKP
jgi:serine/threonine-protein kinase